MLDILLPQLGKENSETLKVQNNLAAVLYAQGKYQEALPLFETTYAYYKKTMPQDDPVLSSLRSNIDMCYDKLGQTPPIHETEPHDILAEAENQGDQNPKAMDLVPQKVKDFVINSFTNNNTILSDLTPLDPVYINKQGVVFPYRCTKKSNENSPAIDSVLLFAAKSDPVEPNKYSFLQSRVVSFSSYQETLNKGGEKQLVEELIDLFNETYF